MGYIIIIMAILLVLLLRVLSVQSKFIKEISDKIEKISKSEPTVIAKIAHNKYNSTAMQLRMIAENIRDKEEWIIDNNIQMISLLDAVTSGLIAIDGNERILFINDIAKEMLGVQSSVGTLIFYDVKDKEMANIIKSLLYNNKGTVNYQHENRFFELSMREICNDANGDRIGRLINIIDQTEMVKTQNIRSEFVSNVTHELKTPLTAISGFVETLNENPEINNETRQKFLKIIEKETHRLEELIDDVLLLSFVEQNKTKDLVNINLNLFFESMVENIYAVAETKNIDLRLEAIESDAFALSHKDSLTSIFLNLIDNSIKYSNENTTIIIKLFKNNVHWGAEVIDQGKGICKEDLNRVFERFYRSDKARSQTEKGTGLGLAIVKHLVMDLNGAVHLDSEIGKGTKVVVEFPIIEILEG